MRIPKTLKRKARDSSSKNSLMSTQIKVSISKILRAKEATCMKLLGITVSVLFKTQLMGQLQRKDTMELKSWARIPWKLAKVDPLFCQLTQQESLSSSPNYRINNKSQLLTLNSFSSKITSISEATLSKMTSKPTCSGALTRLQMPPCNSNSKLCRFTSNRAHPITSHSPKKVDTREIIVGRSFLFSKPNQ